MKLETDNYTWISLVDNHTEKNVGCLIMNGHVDVNSFIVTSKQFNSMTTKAKKFFRRSEKGRIYLWAELRKHIDIMNSVGESR